MIKPSTLNLEILPVEHRRGVVNTLKGSVIIISDTEIKSYRDGREVDLGIDVYEPVLRFGNNNGIYAVSEDTTDAPGQSEAPAMTDAIRDIWTKRRMAGRLSAIASNTLSPGAIYAARRGQVSA